MIQRIVLIDSKSQALILTTGMDLWIARKITDAHGGQINFFCDPNGNNPKFIIDIPIVNRIIDVSNNSQCSSTITSTEGKKTFEETENFISDKLSSLKTMDLYIFANGKCLNCSSLKLLLFFPII